MPRYRSLAALALLGLTGPAFAQVGCPYPPTPECQTLQRNDEDRRRTLAEEEARRRNEQDDASRPGASNAPSWQGGQAGQYAENDAALQALRARLLAAPALPADRNPLLGRWRIAADAGARAADEMSQLIGMLANPAGAMCGVLFGEGTTTEFRAGSWAAIDGSGNDSLGPVQYRLDERRVYALPDRGVPLLGFEFIDNNRIREVRMPTCVLVRVGAASGATAAKAPAPARAGPAATAGTASALPVRPAPGVCRQTLLDRLGTARIEQARKIIAGRFTQSTDGKVPGRPQGLRIEARGSACDDPRVDASLYDFEADGVLRSITYVWIRPPGPAPAPIFTERVATLARFHALPPPQSPGRLQAETSLGRLVLQDMPERNLLLEAYIAH